MGVEIGYKLEVTVKDKDGKIVEKRKVKGNSFVKNFITALYGLMWENANDYPVNVVDTDGNERRYPYLYSNVDPIFEVTADEEMDLYGILYGTGTKAFDVNDYKLDALIPHGDGDNQLHYYSTDLLDLGVEDNKVKFKIQRPATNNGSIVINVTEIGLVAFDHARDGDLFFLIIRDVLDQAITVNPNQTITATYTIYTTF